MLKKNPVLFYKYLGMFKEILLFLLINKKIDLNLI